MIYIAEGTTPGGVCRSGFLLGGWGDAELLGIDMTFPIWELAHSKSSIYLIRECSMRL